MSRLRDQFIAAIIMIKKPIYLDECIKAAGAWKKTGALTAAEFDQIVAEVGKKRRVITVLSRVK